MYYVLLAPEIERRKVLAEFKRNEIGAIFHYVPLHSSPAGQKYGEVRGRLVVTNSLSERLIRLPLWVGLPESQQNNVIEVLDSALNL